MIARDVARVTPHEHDVAGLDRHVGAGADRDPTSAVTSAGASFTPSPTIATRFPRACELLHLRRLLLRQHLGEDRVDAELLATALGDRLRVAGQHHDLDAAPCSRWTASHDSGRIASATANAASAVAIEQVDDGLPALGRVVGEGSRAPRRRDPARRQQIRPTDRQMATVDDAPAPRGPGMAWKPLGRGTAMPRSSALPTIAARDGCSESRSTAAASRSASSSGTPRSCARHDPVLAQGERARLVEDDGVEVARLLEAAPVPDEQTVPRAERRGDRDDERDREARAHGGRR